MEAKLRLVELSFLEHELLSVSGELKHKISSRNSICSFLLVLHIGVDTSKVQNVVKDCYRPPSRTCLHCVLSCHLVSNVHTTFSFAVECNCFRFLFCCFVDHNRWVECAKNKNVLLVFALVNSQRCGLVVFVWKSLLEYLLCCKVFTSGGTSFRILFRVPTSEVFFFQSCVAR